MDTGKDMKAKKKKDRLSINKKIYSLALQKNLPLRERHNAIIHSMMLLYSYDFLRMYFDCCKKPSETEFMKLVITHHELVCLTMNEINKDFRDRFRSHKEDLKWFKEMTK